MKYWNKQKAHRAWTKVSIKTVDYNKECFLWCQRNSSKGRFYRYFGANSWWFENEQDAVLFVLRWL